MICINCGEIIQSSADYIVENKATTKSVRCKICGSAIYEQKNGRKLDTKSMSFLEALSMAQIEYNDVVYEREKDGFL